MSQDSWSFAVGLNQQYLRLEPEVCPIIGPEKGIRKKTRCTDNASVEESEFFNGRLGIGENAVNNNPYYNIIKYNKTICECRE